MPSVIFTNLLNQSSAKLTAQSNQSVDWLRKMASQVNKVNTEQLINSKQDAFKRIVKLSETSIGKMYMFIYDPKTKQKLPFYDVYPLIFPIEYYDDGFLGINLHYLPPGARASLMDALYDLINNKKYDKTSKLNVSYKILKGSSRYSYFRPCVKRYLFSQVKSNFLYVAPDEWNIALMLPTQRFVRSPTQDSMIVVNASQVYKQSIGKI